MLHIRIVAIGKIKQAAKYLEQGIALYEKRLRPHVKLEWIELPEIAPSPTRTVDQILEKETDAILKQLSWAQRRVLLTERGKGFSSTEFSHWLFQRNPLNGGREHDGSGRMIFIIGGAYGTSERLSQHVTDSIALSPLTFPHQLVRLILMEQLYRAITIEKNEPYHK